jgi:hypothetical protein
MVPLDASTPAYQLGENIKYNLLEPESIPCVRIYDENYGLIPQPEYLRSLRYPAAEWASGQYGMVIWNSHGWGGGAVGIMEYTDAANLNDNYPGTTFQTSCDNAWPELTYNITYSILLNGGIGNIGATRNSWYVVGRTDYTGSMAYKYAMHIVDKQTTGYGLVEARDAVQWHPNAAVFTLYGDPSVRIMPDAPASTVTPTHGCYFRMVQGGLPLSQSGTGNITLFNNSATSLNWTASESADWLDISPSGGVVGTGDSVEVVLTINSVAASLLPGTYTDTVIITDITNDIVVSRDVRLQVDVRADPTSAAVDASSEGWFPNFPPDYVIDGNLDTRWTSEAHRLPPDPAASNTHEWIWINLGADRRLNSVTIDFQVSAAVDYTIRLLTEAQAVSLDLTDDGTAGGGVENWTTIATAVDLPNGLTSPTRGLAGTADVWDFTAGTTMIPDNTTGTATVNVLEPIGRYLLIDATKVSDSYWGNLSIWEVAVDSSLPLQSDFNEDWHVNTVDLAAFMQVWLSTDENLAQDLFPDNKIDLSDFALFAEDWFEE